MTTVLKTPIAASSIPPEWIQLRREIIERDGYAVRAGALNTIEIKSLRTNEWIPLMLPGDITRFETAEDRNSILAQLQRKDT